MAARRLAVEEDAGDQKSGECKKKIDAGPTPRQHPTVQGDDRENGETAHSVERFLPAGSKGRWMKCRYGSPASRGGWRPTR